MSTANSVSNNIEKYSILIIEDNPGDFALVEEFLLEQVKELKLLHAKTYKEAKAILSAESPGVFDAVLLDLSLPDKTGVELISDVVASSDNTPVIILTGYENFSFGVRSLSLGVADYILKDELTPQLLLKSILYSIERKKLNLDLLKHINAIEEQNKKLREIAWIQSHVVRAPLARMMGLIDLFNNHENSEMDAHTILDFIVTSAKELDKVVQDITDKVYVDDDPHEESN